MPTGPQGQHRPADVIGTAVTVAKIATGEHPDTPKKDPAAQALGQKGGQARAAKLSATQRKAQAHRAAATRWTQKQR